jgi:excinuclease ABC subunit A
VLHELVDTGNTVLVIEHNLDVIKTADHVIDLGPEGGDGGGKIVAVGTPEDVAKVKASWTGKFLAETFERQDQRRASAKTSTSKAKPKKPAAKKTAAKKKTPARKKKADA